VKRFIDLLTAICLLFGLALPLLALALLIRRKLGSPVLYCQVRPGLHGRLFTMVKFRTMTDECGPDGALLPDAQRLTPFGRFLRASSLDELPELWNVLKGEMSLVGPRPLLMPWNKPPQTAQPTKPWANVVWHQPVPSLDARPWQTNGWIGWLV
jgi:lipopolysaccharide/colanic/teichoic acid biosynthesis glycosyltransferase